MRKSPRLCGCPCWAIGSVAGLAADASEVTWTSSTGKVKTSRLLRCSRLRWIVAVQLEIELQHVNPRFADEAERTTVLVVANRVAHLGGADPARASHPGHLDIGVRRRDIGVQAAGAGGDGVGRYHRVIRRRAANRNDLTDRVVSAVLRAFHPHTLVELLEYRGWCAPGRRAGFVHADHPGRMDHVAG